MRDTDDVADEHDEQRERQRDVEAVGQADEHVASAVVGAERMCSPRRVRRRPRLIEQRFVRAVRIGGSSTQSPVPSARKLLASAR